MTLSACLNNKDSANEFLQYLNSPHNSIKFTIEFERDNEIPFLEIVVKSSHNTTFITSIYQKKTFTSLYTKWDSFHPCKYKLKLIRTLTYRCYQICSSPALLQSALDDLRKLFLQDGYPQGIINFHVNDVLERNRNKRDVPVPMVPRRMLLFCYLI